MKFILFICLSLYSFYSFSDSCKQAFTNAEIKILESNSQIKLFESQISDIYSREKFQDKKYTLKYLERMNNPSSINQIMQTYPVLTGAEQIELAKIYKKFQDARSFYVLFFSNFRLIHKIVRKKTRINSQEFDDYFQESALAFVRVMKLFDPYKGVQFSTYLTRAIQNNLDGYDVQNTSLRISPGLKYKIYLLHLERQANPEMFNKDREAWIEHVIEKYPIESFKKQRVKEILLHHFDKNREPIYQFANASANKNREEEEDFLVINNHADSRNEETLDFIDLQYEIESVVKRMKNRVKSQTDKEIIQIIMKTQLLNLDSEMTLKEVAKKFNIPYNSIRYMNVLLMKEIKEHFSSSKGF